MGVVPKHKHGGLGRGLLGGAGRGPGQRGTVQGDWQEGQMLAQPWTHGEEDNGRE